ncbi:MAG: LysM peptidoglycan-binding domain-containing protein [Bacilli bacterium]|nr:LysM peptidoglycan-binding domain-containing protein [Bacilli bacterium]
MNSYTRKNYFNPTFYPYPKQNNRYRELVKKPKEIYRAPNLSEVILKFGTNGVEVEELQKILISLNYLNGTPDGYYGRSTEKAVINFQKDFNLAMDGIVGSTTWAYLEKAQNEKTPVNEPTVKEGDNNLFVTSLQMKLNALGYLKEEPDSIFGLSTRDAVREFQRLNNLNVDAIVGPDTWRVINRLYSELNNSVPVIITPMLEGTSGSDVETLQKNLSDLGYYDGNITGVFDIQTGNSVQSFQSDNNLLSTGIVNQKTWEAIIEKTEKNDRSETKYCDLLTKLDRQKNVLSRSTIRLGDSGTDVADLQLYLKELSYFEGPIDSQFGSETNKAVRSFQNTNNLGVDGIVGKNTWSALVDLYLPLAICLPDKQDRYVGVVIDAGHGGEDPGAVSQGENEKKYNLMISQYIASRFSELGIPYSLTRDSDETLTNEERVAKIKMPFGDVSNAIVISNHINAGGGEGAEIIYPLRSDETLARNILTEIGNTGQKTRTYYQRALPNDPTQDYYYIMRDTDRLETLIVEYAFLDNPNDLSKLQNNWKQYAEATVKAVAEYMGYPYSEIALNGVVYIVEAGDSLWAIAQRFGTTVDNIKRLNNLSSNNLSIGQKLVISGSPVPEPLPTSTYTVVAGDTLYSIARKFNTTVSELRKINNLSSDILSIGQTLKITETNNDNLEELSTIYIVKYGDTLWSIANHFDVSVDTIKLLNNLKNSDLSVGQELLISENSIIPSFPADNIVYIVKQGDTLWSLAKKYNTTVDEIKRVNNLSNNSLSIGQNLTIPDGILNSNLDLYTVVAGDTLWSIAHRFGTTADEIRRINNLSGNLLSIGQQLKIPIL